jgi:hypothetical protein
LAKKESVVAEKKRGVRLTDSINLVNGIIDRVFRKHTSIHKYGLKNEDSSFDVWMNHNEKIVTVQSFTKEIVLYCTDKDEATATKFQTFIERGIRQGMEALIRN